MGYGTGRPIPSLLRTPAIEHPDHEPADSSSIGVMDKYMPVPEGLSFDHLDTLGRIGPHVYHLPFQDTLIPWSRRWMWGLRSPPALDDSADLVADCVPIQSETSTTSLLPAQTLLPSSSQLPKG